MLEVGMKHVVKEIVDKSKTAGAVGSGGLDVYATPCMIALMEKACKESVQPHLEEGKGTVGISISTNHKAATPLGMEVRCDCELVEIDRSRLVFKTKCYDEIDEIGEGMHERFIIDNDKFLANVNSKIEKVKK
ncbi:thioesterase family protein [Peptostreptococcus faecalis]|uniref:thioesterase family protein n=1 Tax=Peptostreptococcus faecalis TaxID=2045015 RepID=UPI000C79DBE9|nr:thioesterase family protein [Peptostreptococcus faecalis]